MVSIIILSYNTEALLEACLVSIVKHTKDLRHEILVVDNASSDGSVQMLKEKFPSVKLIESKQNLGFAKGVNKAAEHAKGDYLLLLNSDTEFISDSLKKMVAYAEQHQDVAAVGGYLKNTDNSTSKSFGKFYTLMEVYRMLFMERTNSGRAPRETIEEDWVSGGYMLLRAESFRNIHGFDEHFFMYLEDMELCYRLHKTGKSIVYFPASEVLHRGQGSSDRSFAIVQIYKGLQYFYRQHMSYAAYIVLKLLLIIKAISAMLLGLLTGKMALVQTYRKAFLTTI